MLLLISFEKRNLLVILALICCPILLSVIADYMRDQVISVLCKQKIAKDKNCELFLHAIYF